MSEDAPCEPGLHSYVPGLETCVCGERAKADLISMFGPPPGGQVWADECPAGIHTHGCPQPCVADPARAARRHEKTKAPTTRQDT